MINQAQQHHAEKVKGPHERDGVGGIATKTEPNEDKLDYEGDFNYYRNYMSGMDDNLKQEPHLERHESFLYKDPFILEFLSNGSVVLHKSFTQQLFEDQRVRYGLNMVDDYVPIYLATRDAKFLLRTYIPSVQFRSLYFKVYRDNFDNIRYGELEEESESVVVRDFMGVPNNKHTKFIFRPEYAPNGMVTYVGIEYDEDSPKPFAKDPMMLKMYQNSLVGRDTEK
jgi:hypothetical protein